MRVTLTENVRINELAHLNWYDWQRGESLSAITLSLVCRAFEGYGHDAHRIVPVFTYLGIEAGPEVPEIRLHIVLHLITAQIFKPIEFA